MEQNLALQIKNLTVDYQVYEGVLKVIPGLDLKVKEGERVGLIGETGCGKTTVLKAVAAILQSPPAIINKEVIAVGGKAVDRKKGIKNTRKKVSMIFQDPATSLNPTLKISTLMIDILKSSFPALKKEEYQQMMINSLKAVSMPAPERVLDSYPVELSGGMKQRVCIAMALMKDADLILADEPTTALDVTIEEQILDLLNDLVREKKKSLLIVSHALGALRKMTDRIYVMYAGNVVETASTQTIFSEAKHPYTIGLLAATPKLTGEGLADGIAGDIPSYINPPQGCRFASRCSRTTELCLEKAPPLTSVDQNKSWQVACYHMQKTE